MDEEDPLDYGESDAEEPRECFMPECSTRDSKGCLSLPNVEAFDGERKKKIDVNRRRRSMLFFPLPSPSPYSAVVPRFDRPQSPVESSLIIGPTCIEVQTKNEPTKQGPEVTPLPATAAWATTRGELRKKKTFSFFPRLGGCAASSSQCGLWRTSSSFLADMLACAKKRRNVPRKKGAIRC